MKQTNQWLGGLWKPGKVKRMKKDACFSDWILVYDGLWSSIFVCVMHPQSSEHHEFWFQMDDHAILQLWKHPGLLNTPPVTLMSFPCIYKYIILHTLYVIYIHIHI